MFKKKIPKVSIVIPFFNCPYIDRAIQSALDQSYRNCEVIVVDDGSTDQSERIKPFMSKINYIRKDNGGTATALNAGIRYATGEYFSWLSSDDLYHPEKIARQLQFMMDKNAVICYGNYHLINERDRVTNESIGLGYKTKWHFMRAMRSGCVINGCTVMAQISAIKSAGMFDESLPYTHDYDLWLRMLFSYDFFYFEEPLVYYRVHGNMGSQRHKEIIPFEIRTVKRRHRDQLSRLINMNARGRQVRNLRRH
ncbi:glycosyltransferase [Alkalihalobacillus sp. AL-G]|uniref:glycosyltransferase n=1 Tax=Alkalihalobacillus sp. AL-G TaxID=2926399 RepID=UPI00272A9BB2|nr:glycosyltransferase [Alkalihalobacillus sp. AL-G]WLD94949.1 glycosyltransferase [Alkalihalobacillus sp. AL-G]